MSMGELAKATGRRFIATVLPLAGVRGEKSSKIGKGAPRRPETAGSLGEAAGRPRATQGEQTASDIARASATGRNGGKWPGAVVQWHQPGMVPRLGSEG